MNQRIVPIVIGALVVIGIVWWTNQPSMGARSSSDRVKVEYRLSGSALKASLTYTDASGNIQQRTGVALPETLKFTMRRGSFAQFSAQNDGENGDLFCSITANDQSINTGNASGAFAIVSCSATIP